MPAALRHVLAAIVLTPCRQPLCSHHALSMLPSQVLPVYEHGVGATFYNGCVVAAVEAVLAVMSDKRRVVALEVGAGTGGTASSVLPILEGMCER